MEIQAGLPLGGSETHSILKMRHSPDKLVIGCISYEPVKIAKDVACFGPKLLFDFAIVHQSLLSKTKCLVSINKSQSNA